MRIKPEPAIYKLENTITKSAYVGATRNAQNRKRDHLSDLRRGIHRNPNLQNDFIKFGSDVSIFDFVVLEYLPIQSSDDYIVRREQEWMDFLHPTYNSRRAIPKFGHDLDLEKERHLSTQKGRVQSEAEKEKRKASMMLYWETHERPKITDYHKQMISQKLSGSGHPNWGRKTPKRVRDAISNSVAKIVYTFISPDGKIITFKNMKRFCEENSLYENGLRRAMNGTKTEYIGWVFVEKRMVE